MPTPDGPPTVPAPFGDDRAAATQLHARVSGLWFLSLAVMFGLRYLAHHDYAIQGLVMCAYNCYFVVLCGVYIIAERRYYRK